GRDDVAQTTLTIGIIANEVDIRNLGARAFSNFINNVYATATQINCTSINSNITTTNMTISGLNRVTIIFHDSRIESTAWFQLNGTFQLRIFDLFVTLEENIVNNGIFTDMNNQS